MFFTGTVSPQRYEYICKKYGFKNNGSQDNEIITKIHRLFLERIRKKTGKSVKHWCVTEKDIPIQEEYTYMDYFLIYSKAQKVLPVSKRVFKSVNNFSMVFNLGENNLS